MEGAIFMQAVRENLRFRRVIPWLFLGGVVVLGFALNWETFQPGADKETQYAAVSSIFVFHILALISAILTSTILNQEVENKTIVYLLTRPVPRWKLLFFRYLACSLVVAALASINAVFASAGVYHGLSGNSFLIKDIAALTVGAFAYGAFFMLIGLLFNRAMIVCLLFAFGWETAVPNMPGQMSYLSINTYLQAIAQHPSTGSNKGLAALSAALGENSISTSTGYLTMIVFIVVLVVFGAGWFTHFEFLPREDAE